MDKLGRIIDRLAVAATLALAAGPALASNPVPVPEPGTLSLITVGIGGAYLVSRYWRRK